MNESQKWMYITGLVLFVGLVYLLAPVVTPFLISALFAYLGDPVVDRLERWRLPRSVSVTVVFVVLFASVTVLLLLLIPLLERQISYLVNKLPAYIAWIQHTVLPWLSTRFGIQSVDLQLDTAIASLSKDWKQTGGIVAQIAQSISSSGLVLLAWVANLVLVPVVSFYLMRDWDILMARIQELLPRSVEGEVSKLAKQSNEILGAFIRGQFMVMMALGTIYSVGLGLIGLELALLIGMLAGLVSFVPYLGFIVGVVAAGIAILVQTQDIWQLLWVLLVFGVGQLIEGTVLTPLLVGDRIGLHPVAVIFAVLAGGQLFGFFGILLALPIAAVLAVLIRHVHERYLASDLYL